MPWYRFHLFLVLIFSHRPLAPCYALFLVQTPQLPLIPTRSHGRKRGGHCGSYPSVLFTPKYYDHSLQSTLDPSSDGWTAGNFTRDLQQLQRSYNYMNAEEELRASQRLHVLNEFSRQRRDLYHDIHHFVLPPVRLLSLILSLTVLLSMSRHFLGQRWPQTVPVMHRTALVYHGLLEMAILGMNGSFWIYSVFSPLLLAVKKFYMERRQNHTMVYDNDFLSLISLSMKEDDAVHPCSDYLVCLLNQWISSISGALIFLIIFLSRHHRDRALHPSMSWTILTLQTLTRLGSVVSIHQFPGLLYQLQRDNQPRPMSYLITKMKHSIRTLLHILPWGLSFDVLQIFLLALEQLGILPISKSIYSFIQGYCVGEDSTGGFSRSSMIISLFHVVCMKHRIEFPPNVSVPTISWKLALLIMIPSVLHLIAFCRICQLQRYSSISLATPYDELKNTMQQVHKRNLQDFLGVKWRYKLEWREPKTLFQSVKSMWYKFVVFMFTGWDGINERDNNAWGNNSSTVPVIPKIFSLVDEDMARHPKAPVPDRNTWVQAAMEKMSSIHENNYKRKNFEDPLGIALQQTLGIGLSFDFDHDTPLKDGETPSIHRLRARLAKSAIKRFQELPNELKEKVDRIQDPDEKLRAGLELVESAQLEVREMVHSLVEYIPTNAYSPEDKPFDIDTLKKTDAELLPESILSFEPHENVSDPWDEVISSYDDSNNPDYDAEEIRRTTSDINPYDGLEDVILA